MLRTHSNERTTAQATVECAEARMAERCICPFLFSIVRDEDLLRRSA